MGNIPSLNILSSDTIADVPPINENFERLRVEINDNDNRITNLKNQTTSSLTSVQNQMTKDKEELLEELGSTAETKLDLDLNNISDEAKEKIIYYGMPDYKAGITKALKTTYTAEKDGIIVLSVTGSGNESIDVEMYVDEVLINESDSWMRDGGQGWSCWGLVPKDSTYRVFSDFSGKLTFYPMKGAL